MLERLDEVPWDTLEHAYGGASDVPGVLRDIAAGTDRFGDLFGNLYHQGTVYPATVPAVPFLIELAGGLDDPELVGSALSWLAHVANGVGYQQVHGSLGASADLAVDLASEGAVVTAVHAAVCAGLPMAATRLAHPVVAVRRAAAALLGVLHGVGRAAATAVLAARVGERDPLVRAILVDALRTLAAASPATERWRLDPASWTDPLDDADRARIREALRAALGAESPAERVTATDALLLLGEPVEADAAALAADLVAAVPILAGWDALAQRPWLRAAPALQLAVLAVRALTPGAAPTSSIAVRVTPRISSSRIPSATGADSGSAARSSTAETSNRAPGRCGRPPRRSPPAPRVALGVGDRGAGPADRGDGRPGVVGGGRAASARP